MNRNDFRNPLIKSGIILLFVFLLISIVASSPADGFFGSTYALITGIIRGILFLVALAIGLVFSITILIGIFLMAVSFHSVDKAKDLFEQLKESLASFYCRLSSCRRSAPPASGAPQDSTNTAPNAVHPVDTTDNTPLKKPVPDTRTEQRLSAVEKTLTEIELLLQSIEQKSAALQAQVEEISNNGNDERFSAVNASTVECSEKLEKQASIIESAVVKMGALEQSFQDKIQALETEVAALDEKISVPEVVTGILSYIDIPADREELTKKTEEAVARGLTYAQADDFFKSALPAKVYKVLGEHPRLTKDFIRSVKKKFA